MRKNSRTKYDICARKKEYVLHGGSSDMEIRQVSNESKVKVLTKTPLKLRVKGGKAALLFGDNNKSRKCINNTDIIHLDLGSTLRARPIGLEVMGQGTTMDPSRKLDFRLFFFLFSQLSKDFQTLSVPHANVSFNLGRYKTRKLPKIRKLRGCKVWSLKP